MWEAFHLVKTGEKSKKFLFIKSIVSSAKSSFSTFYLEDNEKKPSSSPMGGFEFSEYHEGDKYL